MALPITLNVGDILPKYYVSIYYGTTVEAQNETDAEDKFAQIFSENPEDRAITNIREIPEWENDDELTAYYGAVEDIYETGPSEEQVQALMMDKLKTREYELRLHLVEEA